LLTLNQIIDQIKTLANAHYQIAEVGVGTIAELQSKPDREYPLLWLSNEGGTLDNNYKVDNIRLTMFGRVTVGDEGQDDDASELEVLSDMQLILLDFLNYFHQNHGQDYVTDKSNTLEHFTERTNDRTAGYSTVLELKQFYDWNKCQIPQSGASIPPTVDGLTLYDFCDADVIARLTPTQISCLEAELCGACADATVQINGIEVATPASGATVDIPVNLDGVPSGSWDGDSWEVTSAPCADATVQLNGVDMTDIPSGDTENIQVRQSSGSTLVGSKQGQYWRIDDSDISINGSPVADVMAEDSLDIDVTQDGSPVGSWNGSEWIVPSCTPSASVSVALDDTTPEYDQTVQITATATGITATSYIFYLPTREGYQTVQQASNVYNWTCRAVGAFSVQVAATDGSSAGIGEESGTQSGDVNASAIIAAHNTVTGNTMGAVQQAAVLNAVLRLKGAIGTFNVRIWDTAISQGWEWLPYIPINDSTANALAYSVEFFDPSTTVTLNNFVSGDFSVDGLVGGSGKFIEKKHAPDDYPQNDAFGFTYINTYNSGGIAFGSTDLADPLGNPGNSFFFKNLQFGTVQAAANDIRRSQINPTNETGANDTEGLCGVWRLQPYYTQGIIGCALRETEGTLPNSTTPASNKFYGHASNSSGGVTRESSDRICGIIVGQANNLQTLSQVKYVVETFQEEIVTGGRNV